MASHSLPSRASPVSQASTTLTRTSNRHAPSSSPITDLRQKLKDARQEEYYDTEYKYFVPISTLRTLIQPGTVSEYLLHVHPTMKPEDAKDWAQKICVEEKAIRLFASLVFIKKGGEICALLDEGVTDKDLPLRRKKRGDSSTTAYLQCRDGKPIQLFQSWHQDDLRKLGEQHFMMLAPVFQQGVDYEEFIPNTPLPFVEFEDNSTTLEADRGEGASSEVFKKTIHPAHHDFEAGECNRQAKRFVAVKILNNPNPDNFDREVRNLRKLDPKHHPHIVNLLCTFKHKGKHHLIFPWADSNLMQYWESHPTGPQPQYAFATTVWAIRQMQGIASGLALIHDFKSTFETVPPTTGSNSAHQENSTRATETEKPYGRHGDIKPENILWFRGIPTSKEPFGRLQIADLGLGRFHSRGSRSAVDPITAQATLSYEPPECKLNQLVSQKYDIWSLGCVLLEWATWLLKGYNAIEKFSDERNKKGELAPEYADDTFFQIATLADKTMVASVSTGVEQWVAMLHSEPNATKLMHDLLDLIMDKMLVVNKRYRTTARKLKGSLQELERKATADMSYALDPVAYTPKFPKREPGSLRSASTWSTPNSGRRNVKDRRGVS